MIVRTLDGHRLQFMRFFSVFVGMIIILYFTSSAYAEVPIRCRAENSRIISAIECTVLSDKAVLTDAKINRGRCESPIPTADENRIAIEFAKAEVSRISAGTNDVGAAEAKIKFQEFADSGKRIEKKSDIGAQLFYGLLTSKAGGQVDRNREAFIKAAVTNPAGEYLFGDKIAIFIFDCDILEYTLTVNGNEYTASAK